jgi:glycosyltransferase involved in cell wall biosynthesis
LSRKRTLLLSYEFAPFKGGIARVVEGLAAGAASLGHDVHVLAPDYFADQSAADRAFPFAVHRFPGDFCSILSFDKLTRFAGLCRRMIAQLQPNVLHATDPQSQMALTALARLRLVRDYSFTVHGTEILRYRHEPMPRLWMHGAMRRPRAIFAVSKAVRDLLLDTLPANPDRVFVSHPGIAPAWFDTPPTDHAAVRRHWDLPDDAFVCLTISRRVPDKGHERVLEALALLPPPIRAACAYVIVGTGPEAYARDLEDAAARAGIRLVLVGEVDDLTAIRLADASDLFVMLSRQTPKRLEGFGLSFIEAAARGLPSLATATGGVAEAVIDDETGIALPPGSPPPSIAAALQRLIQDGALRSRLGNGARGHAQRFTWVNHARAIFSQGLDA